MIGPCGDTDFERGDVVATAAAMPGSVRSVRSNGKTLFEDGLGGVENDEYNVVFWKTEPEQ